MDRWRALPSSVRRGRFVSLASEDEVVLFWNYPALTTPPKSSREFAACIFGQIIGVQGIISVSLEA